MVKIMRAFLPFAGLLLASGHDKMKCAIKSLGAVDDLLDAAIYIWAATERCEQSGESVRCEVDIASAVESVNGMINVILKTTEKCGSLKIENPKCGLAAGVLTKSLAGLAASSGELMEDCPAPGGRRLSALKRAREQEEADETRIVAPKGALKVGRKCVVDLKHSLKALFKSIKYLTAIKHKCDENSHKCAKNGVKLVAALAGLGEYLAGIVGHCVAGNELAVSTKANVLCASASAKTVKELTNVAKGGVELSHHCHLSESRLYALEDETDETNKPKDVTSSSLTLALAAMLPLAAVLGFMGGSRLSKARPTRDFESLMTVDAVEE